MPRKNGSRGTSLSALLSDRITIHGQFKETLADVIDRALDFEDIVRAGIIGDPWCWKHDNGSQRFTDANLLLTHVRQEHPEMLKRPTSPPPEPAKPALLPTSKK